MAPIAGSKNKQGNDTSVRSQRSTKGESRAESMYLTVEVILSLSAPVLIKSILQLQDEAMPFGES